MKERRRQWGGVGVPGEGRGGGGKSSAPQRIKCQHDPPSRRKDGRTIGRGSPASQPGGWKIVSAPGEAPQGPQSRTLAERSGL